MGVSMDGDAHVKPWMVGSPKMSGKNGGGSDRRESSFAEC